ncbi:helix-turn-helix domain-containing protein [Sulfobacillus harzensis]|uniref:Helix-turn-helix transcriptional regulator n=1 Tax=Sulfobacillus harzensis TaxID=2729629 RepID=A0A7Y0Q3I3_9FIRM|nr:helix-turn-helix transcriptional regulator [Sulfobacillus harzensis]NMP23420.1 helix-turn-helix transcriptional regulator [Sulfobacillus harzensis]
MGTRHPLGEAIRMARHRRHWTQQQLAMAIPVDSVHLSRWETGARTVPLAAVARIALLLNAPGLLQTACDLCPIGQAQCHEEVG